MSWVSGHFSRSLRPHPWNDSTWILGPNPPRKAVFSKKRGRATSFHIVLALCFLSDFGPWLAGVQQARHGARTDHGRSDEHVRMGLIVQEQRHLLAAVARHGAAGDVQDAASSLEGFQEGGLAQGPGPRPKSRRISAKTQGFRDISWDLEAEDHLRSWFCWILWVSSISAQRSMGSRGKTQPQAIGRADPQA